jgi:hypothetical protein
MPQKILGTMAIDRKVRFRGSIIHFLLKQNVNLINTNGLREVVDFTFSEPKMIRVEIGEYLDKNGIGELAIKSDEIPLKTWEKVPGFIPFDLKN